MISDEKCKQILNKEKTNYTKEEITLIKELLLELAKNEVATFIQKNYENSRNNESGIDR